MKEIYSKIFILALLILSDVKSLALLCFPIFLCYKTLTPSLNKDFYLWYPKFCFIMSIYHIFSYQTF